MKRNTYLIVACIVAIGFLRSAEGQSIYYVAAFTNTNSLVPGLSGSSPLDLHAVNPRAIKDFNSRFIGASNKKNGIPHLEVICPVFR